jgi:hypothetical protein
MHSRKPGPEVDTKACAIGRLYDLLLAFKSIGLVFAEGGDCVVIKGAPYFMTATPAEHQLANLIGRNMLYFLGWGMHMDKEQKKYDTFNNPMFF